MLDEPVGTALAEPNGGDQSVGEVLDPNDSLSGGDGNQDQGSDNQDQGDQGQDNQDQGQDQGREGQGAEGAEGGRLIPQHIRALKDTDPKAYKQAKTDFFELRDRRQAFPTAQEAREARELIDDIGGRDGLSSMREDVGFFRTAARQFVEGNPQFIRDLAEDDPIAFGLHFPVFIEEMQKRDFNSYADTVSKLWHNEFETVGLSQGVDRALAALEKIAAGPDRDLAVAAMQGIRGWMKSISDRAQKAEDPRVKTMLKERADRMKSEAQSEQETMLKEYRTESANSIMKEASSIFDSMFKNWKLEPARRTRLLQEVVRIANGAVVKDAKFVEDRDKLLNAGDRNGAMRLTKARYSREWQAAVKEVAGTYRLGAGPGKNQQQQQQQRQNQGGTRTVDKGWIPVNVRPAPEDMDRSRTSNEMILLGRAILRDGRKVDWSALKRKAS